MTEATSMAVATSALAERGRRHLGPLPLLVVTAALCLFLGLTRENFFSASNLYSLVYGVSIECLAVFAFTYVMVLREIDLSVGAVYALAGVMSGYLLLEGVPMWGAITIALAAAALVGLINGLLVVRLRVNSLMLTIGTMLLVRGLVGVMTTTLRGNTFPRPFRALSREQLFGVNVSIVAMVVLAIAAILFQQRSVLFRHMCYIGENLRSAVIYGVRADRIKVMAFVASSFMAGVAGIYTASRITHADANMGLGMEFTMITAAVLGGASLYGGRGNAAASMLGLFLIAVLINGMAMYDIEPVFQQFVIGALLITTVAADTILKRRG
ncbi:ABC transporter permease [Geminicoccus harenae]|uniref:ABC transporter permease n=1 Tax=Geminicoccus harenae TaxID=2498453 RepID=UPI00168BFD17|nr:ABC transporter permease [Geminicoccus harenae]